MTARDEGRDEAAMHQEQTPGGVAPVPAGTQGGEDQRRRGWFWHWNSLVTQYAPLIGLKGVGLLNSYTVWTDRREESPHRGYAFPSQQSEADFYGEDRAELITINKILVTLDLIEIRKEMVHRTDPQGRRWKVPHNFYRVKDHDDRFTLSVGDVLKVADLAERDKTVYRYLRRVFSPRFAPIDSGNVWTRILPEVRQTAVWQRLAERAEAEETRASARTKAGHAARKGAVSASSGEPDIAVFPVADAGDNRASSRVDSDSVGVDNDSAGGTFVEPANTGSPVDVGPTNSGFSRPGAGSVEPVNGAGQTSVAPVNTTYHQERETTTTGGEFGEFNGPGLPPGDAPGRLAAIRAFEAANDRASTPAERTLLAQIAGVAETAAVAGGRSGWAWVEAGIMEAVEAGSRYVAPRRVREIVLRWERDGYPQDPPRSFADNLGPGPDLPLPGGRSGRQAWAATLGLLARAMDRAVLEDLAAGTFIAGCAGSIVTVAAPDEAAADRWAAHAGMVERMLSETLGRRVEARFLASAPGSGDGPDGPGGPPARPTRRRDASPAPEAALPVFLLPELGMASGPVWSMIVAEAEAAGGVTPAESAAWLRPAALLGREDDGAGGALIVGAPHAMARVRLETRHRAALERAASVVLGRPVGLRFVVTREWMSSETGERAAGA